MSENYNMTDRDWSEGHSPAQNRRYARVKPALDKAQASIEARYDDSPEEFYARLFDGASPEQRQLMLDVMQRLPADQRFETVGGLMSLLGYGTGDNRATVSRYKVSRTPKGDTLVTPSVLGYYPPRNNPVEEAPYQSKDPKKLLAWHEGEAPVRPGAGIAVFDPAQAGEQAKQYTENQYKASGKYGDYTGGLPSTVWHELAHRGFDSPAMDEFYRNNRVRGPSVAAEHELLAALGEGLKNDPRYDPVRDQYAERANEILQWITPERERQFGITKYHTPSYDSLEQLIRLLRSK